MTNHLEQHGAELLRLGYDVVPIPAGKKGCLVKGWQTIVANEPAIMAWAILYAGCGIRGPKTVGVDIDCRDEALTQHMLDFSRQQLGHSPHRVGKAPKALLPYRCEQPFGKVKSREFISPDGQKHLLEVLAEGQQFVTAHIHPDTQEPYLWHYADGLTAETLTTAWADLPLITAESARSIVAEFERQCAARAWEPKGGWRPQQERASRPHRKEHRYTEQDAKNMLACLDPNMSYDGWLRVGMALHHGGFPVELWDSWSKQAADKYKAGECLRKWETFRMGS